MTYEQRRGRRKRAVRSRSINVTRLTKKAIREGHVPYPEDVQRPRARGDCADIERPCPFVSCRYNLYLDVGPTGSIKLNFPDLEPGELTESCALDVAEHGGETLDFVAELMNLTRERARQIEVKAKCRLVVLRDHLDDERRPTP